MPCHTRMKKLYFQGLLWLYLLGFGYTVLSTESGYLDFDNLPDTNFSCVGKVIGGYYADLETNCQMFHVCTIGQLDEPMDIRFLCLNGTVFDQETRVCERIDEVDCSKSERFYSLNLELYGNTQPSPGEDNSETDPPIIIKASTTSTTTTTTQKPTTKTTRAPFYTTPAPMVTTVTKVISAHHFPISGGPDIRFNPEEINISLNPGSSPHIRSKTVSYQQQVFSDSNDNNKKVVVTTHTSYGNSADKEDFMKVVPLTQRVVSMPKARSQSAATPADINYGFTYDQTEDANQEYRTEQPQRNYQYHHSNFRHGQFRNQFKTTTYRTEHITTRKHPYVRKEPTTYRTPYVTSLKTPTYHSYSRTENPQRLQLPLPLLPTLPPLTFSSPAPFSLGHHIESKRYTNDHQPPPRIIISASASVSDNSGRRLNYSLGTIGVAPFLEDPPKSYDDYKDHHVVLDPFYHDVPKIKTNRRRKRQIKSEGNEQAAADVLRFLFEWYSNQQRSSTIKVPVDPEIITEINDELAPIVEVPEADSRENNFRDNALFTRKNKFNIVGDVLSVTEKERSAGESSHGVEKPSIVSKSGTEDYVDDNYEAVHTQNTKKNTNENEENNILKKEENAVTEKEASTTEEPTTTTTTPPPTTTTTEPTTTSRIMGILRNRAIAHQKRIRSENQRRYSQFLASIKPKIRSINKGRTSIDLNPKRNKFAISTLESTTSEVKDVTTEEMKDSFVVTATEQKLITTTTTVATPTAVTTPSTTFTNMVTSKDVESMTVTSTEEENLDTSTSILEPLDADNKQSHSEENFNVIEAPKPEFRKEFEEIATESLKNKEPTTTENSEIELSDKVNDETRMDEETEEYSEEGSILTEDTLKESETTTLKQESQLKRQSEETGNSKRSESSLDSKEDAVTSANIEKEIEETENAKVQENSTVQDTDVYDYYDDYESVNQETPPAITTEKLYNQILPETTTSEVKIDATEERTRLKSKSRGRAKYLTITSPQPEYLTDSTTEEMEERKATSASDTTESNNQYSVLEEKTRKFEEKNLKVELSRSDTLETSTSSTIATTDRFYDDNKENFTESALTTENIEESTRALTEATVTEHEISEHVTTTEETGYPSTETTVVEYPNTEPIRRIAESTTSATNTAPEPYQTITTESNFKKSTTQTGMTATNLTPAETTTTETPSIPRDRSALRRTRPPRTRTSSSYRKPNHRHRFSAEDASRPAKQKPAIEEEIIEALTNQSTTTEAREEVYSTSPRIPSSTVADTDEAPATDAPLFKSANPTQAESAKDSLHTTPLSMNYKLHVRKEKLRSYVFNCFDKPINKFYSDPRDCRLFHYCTSGYTKNQLLDMKFVCDLGTYFDEEKLICTKTKPKRCL